MDGGIRKGLPQEGAVIRELGDQEEEGFGDLGKTAASLLGRGDGTSKGPEVGMNLAISSNKTSECLDQRFCVGCRHWYGGCQ